MEKFFNGGGTTTFIDRIAGSLGIHASTIKIVSVYEGSLVVNYAIENDDADQLAAIESKQTEAFATGAMDVGAPILDVQAYTTSDATATSSSSSSADASNPVSIIAGGVVSAPGYAPITITAGAASLNTGQKSVFIPKDLSITIRNQTTQTFTDPTLPSWDPTQQSASATGGVATGGQAPSGGNKAGLGGSATKFVPAAPQ